MAASFSVSEGQPPSPNICILAIGGYNFAVRNRFLSAPSHQKTIAIGLCCCCSGRSHSFFAINNCTWPAMPPSLPLPPFVRRNSNNLLLPAEQRGRDSRWCWPAHPTAGQSEEKKSASAALTDLPETKQIPSISPPPSAVPEPMNKKAEFWSDANQPAKDDGPTGSIGKLSLIEVEEAKGHIPGPTIGQWQRGTRKKGAVEGILAFPFLLIPPYCNPHYKCPTTSPIFTFLLSFTFTFHLSPLFQPLSAFSNHLLAAFPPWNRPAFLP